MDQVLGAVMFVLLIALIVYFARSWRRGGYGPPIKTSAWTRAGRLRTNRAWAKHGWAEPYDAEGNMLPRSQRTLPPKDS